MRRTPIVFFFNDTATTEIYTLSLHDALPISRRGAGRGRLGRERVAEEGGAAFVPHSRERGHGRRLHARSEEHTSELQSQSNLVCRLLLEKKKIKERIALWSGQVGRRECVHGA